MATELFEEDYSKQKTPTNAQQSMNRMRWKRRPNADSNAPFFIDAVKSSSTRRFTEAGGTNKRNERR